MIHKAEGIDRSARTVSISATGWVTSKPDVVQLSIGVAVEAEAAGAALARANAGMAQLTDGLKEAGIAASDLQTSEYRVSPRYKYSKESEDETIDGYRASGALQVVVRNVARLEEIMKRAIALGGNHISYVVFDVADVEKLRDAARVQAMDTARHRGELYAKAAGAQLGAVLSIHESPRDTRRHRMPRYSFEDPSPMEMGLHRVGAEIDIVYELY